ncbi:MAG: tetratricopeptide repeat protein [Gammaproteobacteria bacterium]|nr:tetratricopeptide repeat protein [Gammaproteobacteria bacterium]
MPYTVNNAIQRMVTAVRLLVMMSVLVSLPVFAEDDETVKRLLEEGAAAMNLKDFDSALQIYNKILVLNPNHPETYFRLGQLSIFKKDAEGAQKNLLRATQLDPLSSHYSLNLGAFLERIGKRNEALEEYQRLVDTGSRDSGVKEAEKRLSLATGQALAKKGEMSAALLVFNGLQLDYPEDPIILANIGATYVFLNRIEEAETTFKKLVSIEPRHIIGHMNLGNIYERSNRPDDAMRHFKIIIDINADPNITLEAKIRYGIINGREYLRRQDWSNAVKIFQEVVNLDPKRTEAFFNIALANLNLGNVLQAEKGFNAVLKVTPDDFSARLNLGNLYLDIKRFSEAKEQFQYIIDRDKGRYAQEASVRMNFIHTSVADEALQAGKVEESLREYKKALDYYSGNVRASFNRGLIYIKQSKYEEARIEFESVIRHDPQNLRGRANLANVYEQLGDLSKAAEQYEIIIQIDKDSEEGKIASSKWRITKARGLWAEKKLSAAQKVFAEIVADQPNNIEALFYLGTIQQSKGLLEESAGAFHRILQARPGNQRVRLLLAKLYEQLGLDQLAASEYQQIIFNGAEAEVVNEATVRLSLVEGRLSGFSNNYSYVFLADSNANMNDASSFPEVRSDMSLNVLYSQSLLDDLSYKLIWQPSFSQLHIAQVSYLNNNYLVNIVKGTPRANFTIQYGQQNQASLETEGDLSNSWNLQFTDVRTLFLPAAFKLAPEGYEGENISTGLSISGSLRNIQTYAESKYFAYSGNVGFNLNQALAKGFGASVGYQLIVNWIPPDRHNKVIQENVSVRRDPLTGLDVPVVGAGQLVTFDSKDYVYNGHSVSVGLNRMLSPGVNGMLMANAQYIGYLNPDSASKEGKRRNNLNLTLNATINYNFFKDMSFYISAMFQKNLSSLPTGLQTTSEAVATFQSTSLGDVTRLNLSGGFNMNF